MRILGVALFLVVVPTAAGLQTRVLVIGEDPSSVRMVSELIGFDSRFSVTLLCPGEGARPLDYFQEQLSCDPVDLANRYDAVILCYTSRSSLSDQVIDALRRAILAHGLGLVVDTGMLATHPGEVRSWDETNLSTILPVDLDSVRSAQALLGTEKYTVKPAASGALAKLLYALSLKGDTRYLAAGVVREGAYLWAMTYPSHLPWLVSWEIGRCDRTGKPSEVWCFMDSFNASVWRSDPGSSSVLKQALLSCADTKIVTEPILTGMACSVIVRVVVALAGWTRKSQSASRSHRP